MKRGRSAAMTPDVLIVGQGLAGTLLGWASEEAAIAFRIADPGSAESASAVSAGILNPVTGRRLVKSWRIEALLPLARERFRRIEAELGIALWRDMRVRRLFADDRERRVFAAKVAAGELTPFVGAADEEGFWIERAAQIDVAGLLARSRERWRAGGRLIERAIEPMAEAARHAIVIDCRGVAATRPDAAFGFVPWEFSKGELIEVESEGLAPDVILNRGHWVLPVGIGRAWVGATHESGRTDALPTEAASRLLCASAQSLTGRAATVRGSRVGIRVNLPDKHPAVGRHPAKPNWGVAAGLGAKGALLAPFMASQWAQHLTTGAAFDPEIDVGRWRRVAAGRIRDTRCGIKDDGPQRSTTEILGPRSETRA